MPIPSTKEEFRQYCLRALGHPVIEINVDPDQVEDRIDQALQYFAQYHYDGAERVYLKYQVSQDDIDRAKSNNSLSSVTDVDGATTATWLEGKNYIPVPDSIISVIKVFDFSDKGNINMFDVRYQLRLNDLYDFSSTSIIHYDMTMKHLDLLESILVGQKPIRHNQHMNRLYIDMDWQTDIVVGEYLVIEAIRKIDPSTFPNIWNDMFLKKYATQLIKLQWGANLIKFNGVQMLGAVTINGETIYQQAQEEIIKLEEQIQLAFELPPEIMIG
jgi:hypothetical protein